MDHLLPPRTIPRTRSTLPRPSLDYSPTANGDPVGLHLVTPLQPARAPATVRSPSPEQFSPTSPEVMDANASPVGSSEWGPLYGEDEDLKRALQLSMADIREGNDHEQQQQDHSGLSINGPQFLDYNTTIDSGLSGLSGTRGGTDLRTSTTDQTTCEITLPPELRHLLETTGRTGAHV